jgi:hypothetical protein
MTAIEYRSMLQALHKMLTTLIESSKEQKDLKVSLSRFICLFPAERI